MRYRDRILVVDDDTALLEQTEKELSKYYYVSLAASGSQAIRYLNENTPPDLILLDAFMPEMDGYQTLEAVRSIERCRRVPVILMSSRKDVDAEVKGLTARAADYIVKPFDLRVLLARIELRLNTGDRLNEDKLRALPEPLTETEWRVAGLLVRAYGNEEICNELHYALDTVKKMVSQILNKLQIKNRRGIRKYTK